MEKERDIKKSKKVISKGLKRLDFKIFRIFLERLNNKLIENLKKFLYLTKKYFQKKFLIDLSKTIFFKLKKKSLGKIFFKFSKNKWYEPFQKRYKFFEKSFNHQKIMYYFFFLLRLVVLYRLFKGKLKKLVYILNTQYNTSLGYYILDLIRQYEMLVEICINAFITYLGFLEVIFFYFFRIEGFKVRIKRQETLAFFFLIGILSSFTCIIIMHVEVRNLTSDTFIHVLRAYSLYKERALEMEKAINGVAILEEQISSLMEQSTVSRRGFQLVYAYLLVLEENMDAYERDEKNLPIQLASAKILILKLIFLIIKLSEKDNKKDTDD